MRGYFGLGQLSSEEKTDILDQHKSLYNGYQTMQPQVSNTQPLTVYDFAGDKEGIVVNNKGEVKKYTNVGINEQVEQKEVCDECGSMMMEGECTECGWKGEMGESKGHLDDIYDEEDLNPKSGFDYIEGSSNDVDTFKGMHKNMYKEQDDDYEDPDNEDDGYEDMNASEVTDEMEEQGYTGGGNAPDMDLSNIDPAYDFISNGPDEVFPTESEMDEEECDECWEKMESAWSDEIDEVDVSGSQGIYGDMGKAYDFDSEGPGKAGPYQHSQYEAKDDSEDEDNEWIEIDEDLQESFITQKNKVMEMMNRMKVIK